MRDERHGHRHEGRLRDLHFTTDNEIARGAGAVRKPVDVRTLTASLRREGIHSIARVVVFKDPNLFRYDGNRHAIWNARTSAPWRGAEGEYWVDPHSRLVQDYTISISRELAALGFDEIQFDYIRFPSDGPTHLCRYRHRRFEDGFKSEVIGDFLERAKRAIPVPLSVDIYGFNAMYRFGNWIGQDAEVIASIVDAVCPMVYPSHFGGRYYRRFQVTSTRTGSFWTAASGPRYHRRGRSDPPYLQAFKMLSPHGVRGTYGPDGRRSRQRCERLYLLEREGRVRYGTPRARRTARRQVTRLRRIAHSRFLHSVPIQ